MNKGLEKATQKKIPQIINTSVKRFLPSQVDKRSQKQHEIPFQKFKVLEH